MFQNIDFAQSPFLTIWETTQACDLACTHCRAEAQPNRHPGELSTEEGRNLLSQIQKMGCPIVILSGGDPLKRPDLLDLIRHGKSLGLRVATIPAATSLLTRDTLFDLKSAGLDQVAFSLDFPTADLHDSFRGTPGAFETTLRGVNWAHEAKLPLQINSTIMQTSFPYLKKMATFVGELGVVFWEVFFLVPTGRGKKLSQLTAAQCEEAFGVLFSLHQKADFVLKITEAPHYRRFVAQQEGTGQELPARLRRSEGPGGSMGRAPTSVNAGRGFVFVSHTGDIFPSSFLPFSGGNIRTEGLAAVYRDSALFQELRNPNLLKGICGACEYKEMCGGSRSRAYALTGDYLETDSWCAYRPKK